MINATDVEAEIQTALIREGTIEVLEAVEPEKDTVSHAQIASAHRFEETGLLTRDNGVLLKMEDGSEFQITIVQSKTGEEQD